MKEEILQTALRHYLTHGIREMSNYRLVEVLGSSTKTLYKYYTSKEELLEETLHHFYSRQFRLLEERVEDQRAIPLLLDIWYASFEREYAITNVFFHDLHHYYPELEKRIEALVSERFHKQHTHVIQKGVAEGVFQADMNPEIVMEGIYTLYHTILRTERFNHLDAAPLELLLNTIVVYIRGFCTLSGIRELEEHIQSFHAIGKNKKQFRNTDHNI